VTAWIRNELARLARDTESGQAMVEFVLVFPVQLFLTLAIIQYAFLCHAQTVVGQAAFLGARAAAVSDGMENVSPIQAAERVAARTVGVLTSGVDGPGRGDAVKDRLRWRAGNKPYGYSRAREEEAYTLLSVSLHPGGDPEAAGQGYVACEVRYDYLLQVPVANHFFAKVGSSTPRTSNGKDWTTFTIRRVGFVATPWWGKAR